MLGRIVVGLLLLTGCDADKGIAGGVGDAVASDAQAEPALDAAADAAADASSLDQGIQLDTGPTIDSGVEMDAAIDVDGAPQPDGQPGDMDLSDGGPETDGFPPAPPPDGVCGSPEEAGLIERFNAARLEVPLPAVACDSRVAAGARAQSQYMCDSGEFGFDGPNGEDAIARIRAAGSNARVYSAAISRGRDDPQLVFDRWVENNVITGSIDEEDLGRAGVGFVACEGRNYWVMYMVD